MGRTMQQIIDELEEHPERIMFLYRWLTDRGYTGEASENLCKYLYEQIDVLKKHIPTMLRAGVDGSRNSRKGWKYLDYRDDRRNGQPRAPKPDKKMEKSGTPLREENYLAMEIFRQGRIEAGDGLVGRIEKIGYILDYEMPIGGNPNLLTADEESIYRRETDGYKYAIIDPYKKKEEGKDNLFTPGKCDLIAYNNENDEHCFTIFELKTKNNDEPLIRAVMEAYTYLNMLDTDRATRSFRKHYEKLEIPEDGIIWKASPLLSINGKQYEEYNNEGSYLRKLMKKIDIEPIWYSAGFSVIVS